MDYYPGHSVCASYDAVVVATPPSEDRIPLEYARDCFALPIVHVVIDPEVLHAAA